MAGKRTGSHWSRRATVLGAASAVTAVTTGSFALAQPAGERDRPSGGILLIGDSWAAGLHADPTKALGQVAAGALGLPITVDAVSGTGYLQTAGARTYLERARTAEGAARLVVVQGGSNDRDHDVTTLAAAVEETVAELRARFPAAGLLLLGPGPDPAPIDAAQRRISDTIVTAGRAAGATTVSMLDEGWVPQARVDSVIDAGDQHPTRSGQVYLGLRLAAAVRLLLPEVLPAP